MGAQAADAFHRILVTQVTAERIARIRGIGDHTALAQDRRGLTQQAKMEERGGIKGNGLP